MSENRAFPDQQERLAHEMRLARIFDGPHFWNTADAVKGLYRPESLRVRLVRWLAA